MGRNEAEAWCPQLGCKPHALVPWKPDYGPNEHPYAAEIDGTDALRWLPTDSSLQPTAAAPLELPVVWVNSADGVREMVSWLEQQEEVAIDCEMDASSMKKNGSYLGKVCLIQIASRDRIYIVDALQSAVPAALEDLNRVTTNPAILKVIHGTDDHRCLMRDFQLYFVNDFNTQEAAEELDYHQKLDSSGKKIGCTLNGLLQHELGAEFGLDKTLTREDWTVRPLPQVQVDYAAKDVQHLLPLKDCLLAHLLPVADEPTIRVHAGKESLTKGESFLYACKRVSCQLYSHFKKSVPKVPPWTAFNVPWGSQKHGNKGFVKLVKKESMKLEALKYEALGELFSARDSYARANDVFEDRVMGDQQLIKIAQESPDVVTAISAFKRQMKKPDGDGEGCSGLGGSGEGGGGKGGGKVVTTVSAVNVGVAPRASVSSLPSTTAPAANTTIVDAFSGWSAHCPNPACGHFLLHSTDPDRPQLCLRQFDNAPEELTTTQPLTEEHHHGFVFPKKEKMKKDAVHSVNTCCEKCSADVGNAREVGKGYLPVLKRGAKEKHKQVLFKRKGVDAKCAKDWKDKFESQLLQLGAKSFESGRPLKKHKSDNDKSDNDKSDHDLHTDIIALSMSADGGALQRLDAAAPTETAAAEAPMLVVAAAAEATAVAVVEGITRNLARTAPEGTTAGDGAASNMTAAASNTTSDAAASNADVDAASNAWSNDAAGKSGPSPGGPLPGEPLLGGLGKSGAAGESGESNSTEWTCHCPACDQVLLYSSNIICLLQVGTGSEANLTTTQPLISDSDAHGFSFPRKEKIKDTKEKSGYNFNAWCRACDMDVGIAREGPGGLYPVLKCGSKPSQHVMFKHASKPRAGAKVWKAMHSDQLLQLGSEAGRPYKKHKYEEQFVSETLIFQAEQKPETELVDEWFGATGSSWLGLAHCDSSASKQAVLKALGTKATLVDRSCCRTYRVFAVPSPHEKLVFLLPLCRGSTKIIQGLTPRGIIENIPVDLLNQMRDFSTRIWKLRGQYERNSTDDNRVGHGLLLPCSPKLASSLWDINNPETHLWSSSAVGELARYCSHLLEVEAGDPTGKVVQVQYGRIHERTNKMFKLQYLFTRERPDRRVDDVMDGSDETFRQYLKRKYDCEPETTNCSMWQVEGPISALDRQHETFLIPAVTDVLRLEVGTVDALHRAVPVVLRGGAKLLNLKLREPAKQLGIKKLRQDWKVQLGGLVAELPVLQHLDQEKLEEAFSLDPYSGASYANYERLEFLGDKVLEVVARARVLLVLPDGATHDRCNVIGGSDKKTDGTKHKPFVPSTSGAKCWKCCGIYKEMVSNIELSSVSQRLRLFDKHCWTGTDIHHEQVIRKSVSPVKDKVHADLLEALIGAAFVSGRDRHTGWTTAVELCCTLFNESHDGGSWTALQDQLCSRVGREVVAGTGLEPHAMNLFQMVAQDANEDLVKLVLEQRNFLGDAIIGLHGAWKAFRQPANAGAGELHLALIKEIDTGHVLACANSINALRWVEGSPINGLQFVQRHQTLFPGSMTCAIVRATLAHMMLSSSKDVEELLVEIEQFMILTIA